MFDEKIAGATGSATTSRRRPLGRAIEQAMSDVVLLVQQRSEEIWASNLPEDEKRAQIAALNDPHHVLDLKMRARALIKDRARAAEAVVVAPER